MADIERYRKMFQEAESHADYWIDGPITEFVEDLARLMEEQRVTRAELARRMGTSRAYITKMLGGNANFTLLTMVKLAMALDGAVHIHISDKRAVTSCNRPTRRAIVGGTRFRERATRPRGRRASRPNPRPRAGNDRGSPPFRILLCAISTRLLMLVPHILPAS